MTDLRVETSAHSTTITFHRPSVRNALTRAMLAELADALDAIPDGSTVLLQGAQQTFSSGVDLSEIGQGIADRAVDDDIARVVESVRTCRGVVLAAIEGPCAGAAVEIALACDLRVVTASAFMLLPATRLGIVYRPEAIAQMVQTAGRDAATRLLILGDRIPGPDLVATGLATHLVADGAAEAEARRLADLVRQGVPGAVAATRAVIRHADRSNADLAWIEAVRIQLLASPDRHAAVDTHRRRLSTHEEDS